MKWSEQNYLQMIKLCGHDTNDLKFIVVNVMSRIIYVKR